MFPELRGPPVKSERHDGPVRATATRKGTVHRALPDPSQQGEAELGDQREQVRQHPLADRPLFSVLVSGFSSCSPSTRPDTIYYSTTCAITTSFPCHLSTTSSISSSMKILPNRILPSLQRLFLFRGCKGSMFLQLFHRHWKTILKFYTIIDKSRL